MEYELLTELEDGVKIYARIDDDGKCRVTCTEDNPDYLRWLNGDDENGTISQEYGKTLQSRPAAT